jgi:hypothetical protein
VRAWKDEHFLFAIAGETIGDPDCEIVGQSGVAGGGECCEPALDREPPCFAELEPPRGLGGRPEIPRKA